MSEHSHLANYTSHNKDLVCRRCGGLTDALFTGNQQCLMCWQMSLDDLAQIMGEYVSACHETNHENRRVK